MGLDPSVALGPMDDCLRGEDPRAVLIGDRAFGGGRCVRALRSSGLAVTRSWIVPANPVNS